MSVSGFKSDFSAAGEWLYLNAETSDVHFIIKSSDDDCERIPAHKNLLAGASKVFRAMFYGSTKEKGDVTIIDASTDAFKEFLKLFYFNEVNVNEEYVLDVMQLAHKYDVPNCLNTCEQIALRNLTNDDVCLVYGLAVFYNLKESKSLCEAVIGLNAKEVLKTDGFMECNKNTLSNILKLDSLSCSETQVFDACMEWVKAICKEKTLTKELIQKHLGNAFYDIRFRSITMDELAAIFKTYALTTVFTGDEHKEVVQMIVSKEYKPTMFNNTCRYSYNGHGDVIICSSKVKSSAISPYIIKESGESTSFSVNEPLLFEGIKFIQIDDLYEYRRNPMVQSLWILTIVESREEKEDRILYEDDIEIFGGPKYVSLSRPVIIKKGFIHAIQLHLTEAEFSEEMCTDKTYFPSSMTLRSGHVIKFHHGNLKFGSVSTVIGKLNFRQI